MANSDFNIRDGVLQKYTGKDREVTIPHGITKIGNFAFYNCEKLTSVKIPDSVTEIGKGAFYGCKSLTSIKIPDSVTEIGEVAFFGCEKLTSVNIPDSVTEIGEWAFWSSPTNLKEVVLPKGIKIREKAFSSDTKIIYRKKQSVLNISQKPFVIENHVLLKYQGNDSKVIIPDSVTEIAANAFSECPGVTEISLIMGVKFRGNSFPPDAEIIFRQPEQKNHTRKTVLTFAPLTENEIRNL